MPAGTTWVEPGDVNRDGLADLVTGGPESTILLATPAGTFTRAPESPFAVGSGAEPTSVTIADFDRDGNPDLAFADCGLACGGSGASRVSLFLGDGKGHFSEAPGSPFPTGLTDTSTIAGADLNGDGQPDVVVGGLAAVAVLLGDGHGGLEPAAGSPAVTGSTRPVLDLAVGDLNADGLPDVVTANGIDRTVTALLDDGHGRLTAAGAPVLTGSSGVAQSVALADVDADGALDAVVSDGRNEPQKGDVSVLLGDGHGAFTTAPTSPFATEGESSFGRIGDFNGDGQPDVASAGDHNRNITVLLNANHAAATPSASLLAYRHYFVGETSAVETVAITNTGNGFLRPGSARIAGPEGSDFVLNRDDCSTRTLLVGRTCALTVSFHPSAGGIREASLELPSNVPEKSTTVLLSGTGVGFPTISSVRLNPTRFAVLRRGRRYSSSSGPHHGSQLLLTLSEDATVRVGFVHVLRGHRRRHVCRTKGRKGRRCTLTRRLGHLNFHLAGGPRAVGITGMLGGRPLSAGSYIASVIAVNAQGQSSTTVKLPFRIVR